MQINFKKTALAAAVLGVFTIGSAQASVKIDDFNIVQTDFVAGSGNNNGAGSNSGPLGLTSDFSNRNIMLMVETTAQITTGISASSGAGQISVNKDSDTTAKAWITWTTGAGLDFTMGGTDDSIEYQIIQNNVVVELTFDVMDGDGTTGYYKAADIGNLVSNVTEDFEFAGVMWNSAEDQSGSDVSANIDWTNITQFSLHIDSTAHNFGTDTILGLVQTADLIPPPIQAPEPAGILLMGLGFAGLGAMRRKRA